MSFSIVPPAKSTPDDVFSAVRESEAFPRMSPSDMRQTGIRLKLRFLFTLISLAIFLAVGLVVLLGDPSGAEQQATLGQAAFLQAQTQAQALNQALVERQQQVTTIAHLLSQSPDPSMLQVAQQSDPSVLAFVVVNQDDLILAAGHAAQVGTSLTQDSDISAPLALLPFLQQTLQQEGNGPALPVFGGDGSYGHNQNTWLALAAPVSTSRVLLAVFSVSRLLQAFVTPTTSLPSVLGVILDVQGNVAGMVGSSPVIASLLKPAPEALQALALNPGSPVVVNHDPLTSRADLAVSVALPALRGQYLLLVDAQTIWVPSMRDLVAGHNTPLLLLGIVVFVVFIATWFALPIIRPIRRTTRVLEQTTEEVRVLSMHAQEIASQHTLGVNLLIGASQHLTRRRDAIVRDLRVLQQTVNGLTPHVRVMQQAALSSPHAPQIDAVGALKQALTQIGSTASSIEQGLTNDRALSNLAAAMEGAQEISHQFEAAGIQLIQETRHLETAAASLL